MINRTILQLLHAALIAAIAMLVATGGISAHASPTNSAPLPGTNNSISPSEIIIDFTEDLVAEKSTIEVLDQTGKSVALRPSAVDQNKASRMRLELPGLEEGVYIVAWKTLSTVDGHLIRGSYSFSVGDVSPAIPIHTTTKQVESSSSEGLLRWALLIGTMLMFSIPIHIHITARLLPVPLDTRYLGPILGSATGIAITAHVGLLLIQSQLVSYDDESSLFTMVSDALTLGLWGKLWVVRSLLILSWLVIICRKITSHSLLISSSLGLVIMATISAGSHGAALPGFGWQGTLIDFIHLTCAAAWIGGLPILWSTLKTLADLDDLKVARWAIGKLLGQFSTLAMISVAALICTGIFSAWAQVSELNRLFETTYGRTLLAKISLAIPLLSLGALNLLYLSPKALKNSKHISTKWIQRVIALELFVALFVLLATGYLGSFEPARQVDIPIPKHSSISKHADIDDLIVKVTLSPGKPGSNDVSVSLIDKVNPITPAAGVQLELKLLDRDIGSFPIDMTQTSNESWSSVTPQPLVNGTWQVGLYVERPGEFDTRAAFIFNVGPENNYSSPYGIPPQVLTSIFAGGTMASVGFALSLISFLRKRSLLWLDNYGLPIGSVTVFAGLLIIGSSVLTASTNSPVTNPVLPTSNSVGAGEISYNKLCANCHGLTGEGNTAALAEFEPPPANLVEHVPLHNDQEHFLFISDGIDGSVMPGFGNRLTDTEIWNLINYLRTLKGEKP